MATTPGGGGTTASAVMVPVAGLSLSDLSDTFGADRDGGARSHKGIDIFADTGTPVVAVRGGTVVKAGTSSGAGGNRVWVQDDNGLFHYYAHLNSISVSVGQRVGAGQTLGGVGKTGNAATTPPHLHYSVNPNGHTSEDGSYNPYEFLNSGGATSASSTGPVTDATVAQDATPQQTTDPSSDSDMMTQIVAAISAAARDGGGKEIDMDQMLNEQFDDFREAVA